MIPIPERGLDEVLRSWSGKGQLFEALALAGDPLADVVWSAAEIQRRAHRVLFAEIAPTLSGWPTRRRDWLNALPAESRRRWEESPYPTRGVAWGETLRVGWPPKAFVARPRSRTSDTLPVRTLRWTVDNLLPIWRDAASLAAGIDSEVAPQLGAAEAVLGQPPLSVAVGERPSPADLRAVESEGRIWRSVARTCRVLTTFHDHALEAWARRIIYPDDLLSGRLFQLAVLGEVLVAAREVGATTTSLHPIAMGIRGPNYVIVDQRGRRWDLWFEAGRAWEYYGKDSPYVEAAVGLGAARRPIGADLLLTRPNEESLVVECKYSANVDYVGPPGYHQVVAYLSEVRSRMTPLARALAVGPDGVVTAAGDTVLEVGPVSIVPASVVADRVVAMLDAP
jgi:hypothetical protein